MSPKINKKLKNKIIGILFLSIIIVVIIYVLYNVIGLIAVPSDVVVIEDGIITSEESAIRVCYKR